jgi:VWFA-related protein
LIVPYRPHSLDRPSGRPAHASIWVVVALLLLPAPVRPAEQQQESPASESKQVFPSGTAAVLLDLVVRDKKGHAVPDLREDELEVYEDGVKQKIEGFRRIESAAQPEAAPAGPAPLVRPDAAHSLNFVTLVFDQLDVEGRKLGQKAATSFVEKALGPQVWVSVFQIEQRLRLLLPFSSDPARINEAIVRATSGAFAGVTDSRMALEQAAVEAENLALDATDPGAGPSASGPAFATQAQNRALSNIVRMAATLQRQQQSTTALYPLLALVRGQRALAGRKSLVYISQGLQVPPSLEQIFRSTISAANRSNVSVYAIDARGLNVERVLGASRDAIEQARRASQYAMESRGQGPVGKEEVQLSETAEGALRLNVEGTLADLSESTGGFAITNTNDFRQGMERIAVDLASHYELTYVPPPGPLDGRFRAIQVKTSRKGVTLQARNGYFALPPGESSALFPYEVPLLGALSLATPQPHDFEVHAAMLRFDEVEGSREHKLVVEVPIANLILTTDNAKKTYRVHFSLLAIVKGSSGEIVERFSEDYPFEGPLAKAEGLKLGNVVFKRRLVLAPGVYTLEIAGQDRESGATSIFRRPFEVPAPGSGARMSSLLLIRRVEPVLAATASGGGDPLDVGTMRIVPNLDAPISAAANDKLSLFFIAYPRTPEDKPRLTLEFIKDGKTVGRAQPELPAREADGRIRYVGTFPISSFQPGRYEVQASLSQPEGSCEERASFTIVQ